MKNKIKEETHRVLIYTLIAVLFVVCLVLFIFTLIIDKGEYNYCIEWEGLGGGTLHRDSLLYTCYSIASSTFFCDYEINKVTQVLMIKPIINITKNEEGFITQINYDQPNYFNCTRWLKSK